MQQEQTYETLTQILREQGYRVGISEVGLVFNGDILDGCFLTRPLDDLFDEDVQAGEV